MQAPIGPQQGAHGFAIRQAFVLDPSHTEPDITIQAECDDRPDEVHYRVTGGRHDFARKIANYFSDKSGKISRIDLCFDLKGRFEDIVGAAFLDKNANCPAFLEMLSSESINYLWLQEIKAKHIENRQLKSVRLVTSDSGRTFYLGSHQSECSMRIYEKGRQMRAEGQDVDPEWIRLEFQFRPSTKFKSAYAKASFKEIICARPWTVAIVNAIASLIDEYTPIKRKIIRPKLKEPKTSYEIAKYGRMQYSRSIYETAADMAVKGDKTLMSLINRLHDARSLDMKEMICQKIHIEVQQKINVREFREDFITEDGEIVSYNLTFFLLKKRQNHF